MTTQIRGLGHYRSFALVASLAATTVLASACNGTDVKASSGEPAAVVTQTPSASTSVTPADAASSSAAASADLPSEDTLQTYFDGVAVQSLDSLGTAAGAAQPGSPAAAYAHYLADYAQAVIDAGQDSEPTLEGATKSDGGYKFCDDASDAKTCYEYTDIAGAAGKVSDFSINKKPLAPRVAVGNGKAVPVESIDAKVTFLSAFESSSSNKMFVLLAVKTGKGDSIPMIDASYRSKAGRQSDMSEYVGPQELAKDSVANYMLTYPNAKIGGTVALKVYDADYNSSTVTLRTR